MQEALSGVWSRHQLFVATHTALHCIFVAAHPDSPQPFLDVSHIAVFDCPAFKCCNSCDMDADLTYELLPLPFG